MASMCYDRSSKTAIKHNEAFLFTLLQMKLSKYLKNKKQLFTKY